MFKFFDNPCITSQRFYGVSTFSLFISCYMLLIFFYFVR